MHDRVCDCMYETIGIVLATTKYVGSSKWPPACYDQGYILVWLCNSSKQGSSLINKAIPNYFVPDKPTKSDKLYKRYSI